MPRYEVRLEAQDGSGHFRLTRVDAESKKAARRYCERKELEMVLWEIPPDRITDLLERHELAVTGTGEGGEVTPADLRAALDQFPKPAALEHPNGDKATDEERAAHRVTKRVFLDSLSQGDRAMLHTHFQEQPYTVVSVNEWKP